MSYNPNRNALVVGNAGSSSLEVGTFGTGYVLRADGSITTSAATVTVGGSAYSSSVFVVNGGSPGSSNDFTVSAGTGTNSYISSSLPTKLTNTTQATSFVPIAVTNIKIRGSSILGQVLKATLQYGAEIAVKSLM